MSLVAEDTRTAVEPWRDDAVSTPEGAGVYLGVTQTDLGITYRVELAHGGGTRYYRLDEVTVLPRNRAPKANLTDGVEDDSASLTVGDNGTTIIRSAETAAREEAWMQEHSTPATRKAHEKRVKAALRKATTLGKIPSDKLIGQRYSIGGQEYVVAERILHGGYVVENQTAGFPIVEGVRRIRWGIEYTKAMTREDKI